jgi:prepilin-type processing-associated H-X9-DG protein
VANARAFGIYNDTTTTKQLWDPVLPGYSNPGTGATAYPVRHYNGIKRPTEVMTLWCGASNLNSGYNYGSNPVFSATVDNYQATKGHGFCYPSPAVPSQFTPDDYINPISLGDPSWDAGSSASSMNAGSVTKTYLLLANGDNVSTAYSGQFGWAACNMRFRHMDNTTVNGLFADGHVESRVLGTVLAKDICLNPK